MNNDLLKRMRAYRGYKQYEIAEIIGLSRQTYNYKENGRLPFTSEEIVKISRELSLTLKDVNDIFFNGQLPNQTDIILEGGIVIGLYRYVRVEFWKDAKVCECMNPREKLLFVYLLTNPYTTQIGIYKITIKQIAFDIGFTKPYVKKSLEKFEHEYNIIRYNSQTNELAIRNWGKYNLTRLGRPMEMCIEKELKGVSDVSLVKYVISGIESSRAYEIYSRFLESKSIENTRNYTYVTLGLRGEKEKQKENKKEKENTKVINLGGRDNGKSSREFKPKIKEFDERPSEDMLKFAREL